MAGCASGNAEFGGNVAVTKAAGAEGEEALVERRGPEPRRAAWWAPGRDAKAGSDVLAG
jgi:hypothetical protein